MIWDEAKHHEIEWRVLAAMTRGEQVAVKVVARLQSTYFSHPQYSSIFKAMSELVRGSHSIEISALSHKLVGAVPPETLSDVFDNATTSANIDYWVEEIINQAKLRMLSSVADQIQLDVSEGGNDSEAILQRAYGTVLKFDNRGEADIGLTNTTLNVLSEIEQVYLGTYERNSLLTGYEAFDRFTGGFLPGQLNVIAGLTSMGKTAFALNVASRIASKHLVHIVSLEMTKDQLCKRILSSMSDIPINAILKYGQKPTDGQIGTIKTAAEQLDRLNLTIGENSNVGVMDVRSHLTKCTLEGRPVELMIIDYLQLMEMPGKETKNLCVAETTRQLKSLATEFELPIIVLSQFSRSPLRENRKPALHDLRDSGSIEQDADMVVIVHRDKEQLEAKHRSQATIQIAKNRDGALGTLEFIFDLDAQRFYPQEDQKPEEVF